MADYYIQGVAMVKIPPQHRTSVERALKIRGDLCTMVSEWGWNSDTDSFMSFLLSPDIDSLIESRPDKVTWLLLKHYWAYLVTCLTPIDGVTPYEDKCWEGFSTRIEPRGEVLGLSMFHSDTLDLDTVIAFAKAVLVTFGLEKVLTVDFAYVCSRNIADGFGGASVVITKDSVTFFNPENMAFEEAESIRSCREFWFIQSKPPFLMDCQEEAPPKSFRNRSKLPYSEFKIMSQYLEVIRRD